MMNLSNRDTPSMEKDKERGRRRKKRRDERYGKVKIGNPREVSEIVINNDVLEEIMLRLPVKSLIRFQIVSKHWRRVVKSRSFRERYRLHQGTQEPRFLCLYNNDESKSLTLKTLRLESSRTTCLLEEGPSHQIRQGCKVAVRVCGSCDGLVCIFLKNSFTNPIIVTNPATGRSQTLPLSRFQRQYLQRKKPPAPEVFAFPGFGKDNVTGTYKVAWLHNQDTNTCEVFDFGVNKWRYVKVIDHLDLSSHTGSGPVFAKGWLYWLTNDHRILAYNLHTEMFQIITDRILYQASCVYAIGICSLNDRLWISTDMAGDNHGIQHFWRIKNALDLEWEWEKMFSINPRLIFPWYPDPHSFRFFALIAISKDDKKVLISNLVSNKFIQLLPHPTFLVFGSVFSGPSPNSLLIPYSQSLDFPLL